jgi:asparagine synthase (glutamine-hydrolysing)
MSAFDYSTVVRALEQSIRRNLTDGLLLSGGLDTAMLAYLAVNWSKPFCITVALEGAPAPDIGYAKLVASRLQLEHYVHYFGDEELEEGIRATIRTMKTFDPMEVRNSTAGYLALKVAKDHGISAAMTGDGCDELFGGYSFLFELSQEETEVALQKLWADMRFSSVYLGKELGIEVKLPYLDPQLKDFAMKLDAGLKIKSEKGQTWGKWVLRKAFESIMPREIVWRTKAPIEVGTGTTILPSLFDLKIPESEFSEKKAGYLNEDGVTIRDKEHLYYYEIYRSLIGIPRATTAGGKMCPDCGSSLEERASFCRTCGAYPV